MWASEPLPSPREVVSATRLRAVRAFTFSLSMGMGSLRERVDGCDQGFDSISLVRCMGKGASGAQARRAPDLVLTWYHQLATAGR